MREEQCGIDALLKKIDGLFTKHFQSTWIPNAIDHVEDEMAAVARQIDVLGPSPASLSLEQVLEVFLADFTSPKSMTSLSAELEARVDEVTEARKISLSRGLPPERCIASYAGRQISNAAGNRLPTIQDVMTKMEAESEIIDAVTCKSAIGEYIETMKGAIENCFRISTSSMRIARFEVLRYAISEAVGSLMQSRVKEFAAELSKVVGEHFCTRRGYVYAWSETDALVRAMYETVVRELVLLPLAVDPAHIKNAVLKNFGVSNKSAAAGKKRGRDVNADDESSNSGATLKALVESCAEERAKLAKRKHDLFTALSEIKQL
eukprot:1439727-Pleurochrysis_carterae.AAC.1